MHRAFAFASVVVAFLACSAPGGSNPPASAALAGAADYSDPANWLCRPGNETICTTGLDANVVGPDGAARPLPFAAAANPPIDCFYLYPTVSQEQTTYSDLKQTQEVKDVVNRQAGRLNSRCRVFAPVYRQVTDFGLQQMMHGSHFDFGTSMRDVVAAWNYYISHDNDGRGIVFIGHSQGTILLQTLIGAAMDGRPQQKLLVSAFLAGDPSFQIPAGKTMGGTYKHVPLCTAKAQTGCVYVWASYLKGDDSPRHAFGAVPDNGMVSACDSPAAPGGGTGSLEYFHLKAADAPASDPPWVETVDQFTGACQTDQLGSSFVVNVSPGPRRAYYEKRMHDGELAPGWGLHAFDVALVQGNMLDVLDAEIAAWLTKPSP